MNYINVLKMKFEDRSNARAFVLVILDTPEFVNSISDDLVVQHFIQCF
jgi:hypothetical protein